MEDFDTKGRLLFHRDLKDPNSEYKWVDLLENANLVGSITDEYKIGDGTRTRIHRPVLDLDFPARLIPSTTPGHFHLYLDGLELGWDKYKTLLLALADAGVISQAYARESIKKGFTAARLPHITKQPDDINSAELENALVPIQSYNDWVSNFITLRPILEKVYLSYLKEADFIKYDRAVSASVYPEIHRWLNRAWMSLPDSESVQHLPHWSAFCDLCSESWVFQENK